MMVMRSALCRLFQISVTAEVMRLTIVVMVTSFRFYCTDDIVFIIQSALMRE